MTTTAAAAAAPGPAAAAESAASSDGAVVGAGTTSSSPPPPPSPSSLTVGLLRETYDKWERRAPLTPDQCRAFLNSHPNSRVVVQPSSHRIFTNAQYEAAGATVREDLNDAHVIFGVKRPQTMMMGPNHLLPAAATTTTTTAGDDNGGGGGDGRIFFFFSHVIKGQPENMVSDV
jgi:alpha-aminoadipic semialdehyde synthase